MVYPNIINQCYESNHFMYEISLMEWGKVLITRIVTNQTSKTVIEIRCLNND